mmetsp:Transcript_32078/g.70126  ORF Transcript_32078/g.70126 Transcript_32078/m.70126 type:complete len:203 (+) Transcript_32078:118-726(+)
MGGSVSGGKLLRVPHHRLPTRPNRIHLRRREGHRQLPRWRDIAKEHRGPSFARLLATMEEVQHGRSLGAPRCQDRARRLGEHNNWPDSGHHLDKALCIPGHEENLPVRALASMSATDDDGHLGTRCHKLCVGMVRAGIVQDPDTCLGSTLFDALQGRHLVRRDHVARTTARIDATLPHVHVCILPHVRGNAKYCDRPHTRGV